MEKLLEQEMKRALDLMEALKVAEELEDKYKVEAATRHAKLELRMVYKAIRKHSIMHEKEWKA